MTDSTSGSTTAPGTREADDARLLNTVRAGDTAAFSLLWERHVHAVRHLAHDLVASPAAAEDAVAQTRSRIQAALRRGGGPANAFRPYVLTALRRVCYERQRGPRAQAPPGDPGEPFVDPAAAGLENSLLARAFQTLPERWSAILWHTELEHSAPAEVAALFGVPRPGVGELRDQALEGLRQAYLQLHAAGITRAQCQPATARLGAFVRGDLSARDVATVSAHLRDCAECRAACAELADVKGALRAVIAPLVLGTAAHAYLSALAASDVPGAPGGQAQRTRSRAPVLRLGPPIVRARRSPPQGHAARGASPSGASAVAAAGTPAPYHPAALEPGTAAFAPARYGPGAHEPGAPGPGEAASGPYEPAAQAPDPGEYGASEPAAYETAPGGHGRGAGAPGADGTAPYDTAPYEPGAYDPGAGGTAPAGHHAPPAHRGAARNFDIGARSGTLGILVAVIGAIPGAAAGALRPLLPDGALRRLRSGSRRTRLLAAGAGGAAVLVVAAIVLVLSAGGGSTPQADVQHHPAALPAAAQTVAPVTPAASPSAVSTPAPSPATSPTATVPPPAPVVPAAAKLSVSADASSEGMFGAQQVSFEVTNTGTAASGTVTVTVSLPDGTSGMGRMGRTGRGRGDNTVTAQAAGDGWTCQAGGDSETCEHAALAAGEHASGELAVVLTNPSACGEAVELTAVSGSARGSGSAAIDC